MNILSILQIAAAIFTIAFGLFSVFAPRRIKPFTGLEASSPRAITEIRSVLGGTFVGLGLAPLIVHAPGAFMALGIAYFAIALVRLMSMFLDKSLVSSNWISLASEVVLGVILVL
jgi:hypothetical protein